MYQSVKEKMKRHVVPAVVGAAAVAPMMAAHAEGEIEAGITSLQTTVIGYVGLGISACIAVLLVSLAGDIGIGVAKKWLKKGAN
ncbi:hypothetical protein ACI2KR_31815 [Pseudomonas luteola]